MASGSESDKTVGSSIAALLDEGARLFDDSGSPMEQSPPEAGKTPTTPKRVADLAAAVDGGNGKLRTYCSSSQGRHVLSIRHSDYLPCTTHCGKLVQL